MHQVSIEAEYVSDLDYFDFDSDMEPMVVARAMAREPWDRQYFNRLRYSQGALGQAVLQQTQVVAREPWAGIGSSSTGSGSSQGAVGQAVLQQTQVVAREPWDRQYFNRLR